MSIDALLNVNSEINIDFYRKIVRKYLELNRYKTAQYWAEKVLTLSSQSEQDVYWLALTLFSSKEYHRAAHIIKSRKLHLTNPQCGYLASICLAQAKEYDEAMQILGDTCAFIEDENSIFLSPESILCDRNFENITLTGNSLLSCIHLERGRMYEALENRELAAESFMTALRTDVFCYEAFESLIQHQMLRADEEAKLLTQLPFNKHCPTEVDQQLVRYLYESKLNKYRSVNTIVSETPAWIVEKLSRSLDQTVAEAERCYYNCNIKQCWKLTQEVMEKDPYHLGCLPIHISCLVEQKNANELFLLAHRLVDIYPENGLSWFAVGCYYYVIGKSDPARRFLSKSTVLDKLFGPAWLAYGHSFAAESEHDQAMAAYFKTAQLMLGCHLPLLYIGLENGLTNNSSLAEKFFLQAYEIAPNDPFVLHEMGVIAFQNEQYEKACEYMDLALEKIKSDDRSVLPKKWEPLLNNLGHVHRKLQKYDKAIEYHMKAMLLKPNCYSTHAAIGFCEMLIGQTRNAIESFHKALALKRDDTFSTTMLTYVLDLHVQEAKDANEIEFDHGSLDKMDESILSDDSSVSGLLMPSSLMDSSAMSQGSSRSRFF